MIESILIAVLLGCVVLLTEIRMKPFDQKCDGIECVVQTKEEGRKQWNNSWKS